MAMTSVGQMLSDAREQKKMSIQEISEITKIRSYYLRALEEGRYNVFISETHLRGFLRTYSRFLGVNEDRIMALYRRERRIKDEHLKGALFTSKDKLKFTITPKIVIIPVAAIIVLSLLGYFVIQFRKVAKPPFLEITEPTDNSVVITNKVLVKGQVEKGADLRVNNEKVTMVDSLGFFEIYVTLPASGVNRIVAVAENGLGFRSTVERTVIYEPSVNPQFTVLIRSNSSSQVKLILMKDGVEEEKTIDAGGEITFAIFRECVLKTKDFNAIKLFVDNKEIPLNPPSDDGYSITKIVFENGNVKVVGVQHNTLHYVFL